MKNIKLYSPIEVSAYEGDSQYPNIINGIQYKQQIADVLRDIYPASQNRGIMIYFDKTSYPKLNEKVESIHFSLAEKGDTLYCVTNIKAKDESTLTEKDIHIIKNFVTSQMSDGIGEIVEQIPIYVDDMEINASLWQNNDWKLLSNHEYCKIVNNTVHKPSAPMLGSDGNIYSQLSIAKKALTENGQDYTASEMLGRVMDSKSYDDAIRIICEYVNPVDKNVYNKSRNLNTKTRER